MEVELRRGGCPKSCTDCEINLGVLWWILWGRREGLNGSGGVAKGDRSWEIGGCEMYLTVVETKW